MAAWDRQKGEPTKAYEYFCTFRDLGPNRNLEKAQEICGVTYSTIAEHSSERNWFGRADQWDAHVRRLADRAFLNEAQKKAKARAQAYTQLLIRANEALKAFDAEKRPPTLGQIAAAMKIACEGMRLEDGLETSRVAHEVHDARAVIEAFPAPVRAEVLRALAEFVESGEREGGTGVLPGRSPID